MTNLHQTIQNMKNTTSPTSTSVPSRSEQEKAVDDQIRFEQEIGRAQIRQKKYPDEDVYVEVTPQLFDYLTPDAKAKFIMYKDVIVIRVGEWEKISKSLEGQVP